MKQVRILFILSAFILSGCFSLRIENRKHTEGFYISFKKQQDHSTKPEDGSQALTGDQSEDPKVISKEVTGDIEPIPVSEEGQESASVEENGMTQISNSKSSRMPIITKVKKTVTGVIEKPFSLADEPFNKKGRKYGILSLVLGTLSIPLLFVLLIGVVFAVLAVIFGSQGKKLNKGEANRKGMSFSKAGFVCGIVTLCLFLLFIIWGLMVVSSLNAL